jgi:hypothetical protein
LTVGAVLNIRRSVGGLPQVELSSINYGSSACARELCALFDSFNDRNFAADRAFFNRSIPIGDENMGRGLLLWLIGIPLPIILLIWLFGGLH